MNQAKKPTFKKTFAVPKQKIEDGNTELQPKILSNKNENDGKELPDQKQQLPNTETVETELPELTDKDKENTPTVVPVRNIKPKKSLFQAPSTSEIDKQDAAEEKTKRVKATKKMLKEKSRNGEMSETKKLKKALSEDQGEDVSKPKKIKKVKDSNGIKAEETSKPKKTKKIKVEVTKPHEIQSSLSQSKSDLDGNIEIVDEKLNENKENKVSNDNKESEPTTMETDVDNTTGKVGQIGDNVGQNDDIVEHTDDNVDHTGDNAGQSAGNEGHIDDNVDDTGDNLEQTAVNEGNTEQDKVCDLQPDNDIKVNTTANITSHEPPRSLTNEEYREIFQAVLDRCENTSLDEMFESLKKPVKVKVTKGNGAKAGKDNVSKPKIPKPKIPKKKKQVQVEAQVVPVCDDCDAEKSDDRIVDGSDEKEKGHELENALSNNEQNVDSDEDLKDVESDEEAVSKEIAECEAISELIPDEVISNLQSLRNTKEPNFQGVNETTPEGSEMEYELPVQKTPPPKKSKKSDNHSSIKKEKLAPKQLHFPKNDAIQDEDKSHSKNASEGKIGNTEKLSKEEKKSSKKKMTIEKNVKGDCVMTNKDREKATKEDTKSSKKKLTMEKCVKTERIIKNKEKPKEECPVFKEKSRRKELQERYDTREKLGTWVQCGNKNCSKWRYLSDCEDPSTLPELWTCDMNPDKKYGSCESNEQPYDEDEHIFTNFSEGSVVWAKMAGFPWWPAMIEIDPDRESYFTLLTPYSMYPSHYHVVFFDDKVSRAWVNSASVRKFTGGKDDDDMNPKASKSGKGFASYSKDINKAKTNALLAFDMSVMDRLKNYGFAKRYKGTYGKVYNSDSSQEISKPKKKSKSRKRKIEMISNDMIESALEDSIEGNEDAVLKGFEEVLDAIDDEMEEDDYEADADFEVSEDEVSNTSKTEKKREKQDETRRNSKQRHRGKEGKKEENNTKSKKKLEIKKPQMFIVCTDEEEMVVPSVSSKSLKLDSDVFTMDLNDTDEEKGKVSKGKDDSNMSQRESCNKSKAIKVYYPEFESDNDIKDESFSQNGKSVPCKTKKSFTAPKETVVKVDAVVHAEKDDASEEMETKIKETENSSEEIETEIKETNSQTVAEENLPSSQINTTEDIAEPNDNESRIVVPETNNSSSSVTHSQSDGEETCSKKETSIIELDSRAEEAFSLEQDEQTVPGEESSPDDDDELNLEISNPVEDKRPGQVINHTIAPVTVELAYDSDPFDMEE